MVLQHEIGLKSPILEGLGTLGIRAMRVVLDTLSNSPCWKNTLIAAKMERPVMSQESLKKKELNPSGPGALLLCIPNKAFLISISEGILSNSVKGPRGPFYE